MILDYCVGYPAKKAEVARAMQLTTLWAERSRKYADKIKFKNQIFGIIQGGIFKDLRSQSLQNLMKLNFEWLCDLVV